LFDEWFEEDFDRDRLEPSKNFFKVSQNVLPELNDLVVLDKHECDLFVEDRSERIPLAGEMIQ
jgi:hypothetical protein